MKSRLFSLSIYLAATITGVMVLLYPFLRPSTNKQQAIGGLSASEMPALMTLLLGLCVVVLLFEAQGQMVNTKLIALLGVLVAINSALRFIETAIPGPGGFTPVFFLIILVGYVFGGRVGFLMGALTMLVSALVTGGVGPWLPGQMFTAGWVGMSAQLLHPIVNGLTKRSYPTRRPGIDPEIVILAVFGLLWGFLYGAIMNLWQWAFITGPQAQSWAPGMSLGETVQRYVVFYLVTSLVWDAIAATGNVALVLLFGPATLRALRRFKQRFEFRYQAEVRQVEKSIHVEVEK